MSNGQATGGNRLDWYKKARSRLWSKERPDLSLVRPFPLLVGTFFYTGLSPIASGTVGSLAAAILYYLFPALQNPAMLLMACVIVLVAGIWSGGVIERQLKIQDPGIVVIDEVLGQWIALASWMYAGDLRYMIAAFLFFRIFDIIKPSPSRYFERRSGGTGIMLDDAIAGIYANIMAHLAMYVLHLF